MAYKIVQWRTTADEDGNIASPWRYDVLSKSAMNHAGAAAARRKGCDERPHPATAHFVALRAYLDDGNENIGPIPYKTSGRRCHAES